MDINLRDWIVIIGALIVLAVLLDGYRRMRSAPRLPPQRPPDNATQPPPDDADEQEEGPDRRVQHELPSGGARTVPRRDQDADQPPGAAGPPGEREREVVMVHVISRDEKGFSGEDILQILLACGLRFGDMNFFHRHEAAGRGATLFSVANMMRPGVFDIEAMAGFSTKGLTFFMTVPGPRDLMAAFDSMLETAECVAKNLNGELLDESRSVATRQTRDHLRRRIRDLERRLLAHGKR